MRLGMLVVIVARSD